MGMSRVRVTRDVPASDPHNFTGRDVLEGETFYVFIDHTYGCVDSSGGIALSESGPLDYPFFEFPRGAIEGVP